jgi:hypothetical protein
MLPFRHKMTKMKQTKLKIKINRRKEAKSGEEKI